MFQMPIQDPLESLRHAVAFEAIFPAKIEDVQVLKFRPLMTEGRQSAFLESERKEPLETESIQPDGTREKVRMDPGVYIPSPSNFCLSRFLLTADPACPVYEGSASFNENVDRVSSAGVFDITLGGQKSLYNAPLLAILGRGYPQKWIGLGVPERVFNPANGLFEDKHREVPVFIPPEMNVRLAIDFTRPVSIPAPLRLVLVLDGQLQRKF